MIGPRANGGTAGGNGAGVDQFFDLQNVQVLKGPQCTLFGRNTTGGAVLIVPQKPTDQLEGYLEGSIGNHDMYRLQGVLNIPLAETFKVRLGFERQKRDERDLPAYGKAGHRDRGSDATGHCAGLRSDQPQSVARSVAGSPINVAAFVTNVANEKYYNFMGGGCQSAGSRLASNMPRSACRACTACGSATPSARADKRALSTEGEGAIVAIASLDHCRRGSTR